MSCCVVRVAARCVSGRAAFLLRTARTLARARPRARLLGFSASWQRYPGRSTPGAPIASHVHSSHLNRFELTGSSIPHEFFRFTGRLQLSVADDGARRCAGRGACARRTRLRAFRRCAGHEVQRDRERARRIHRCAGSRRFAAARVAGGHRAAPEDLDSSAWRREVLALSPDRRRSPGSASRGEPGSRKP